MRNRYNKRLDERRVTEEEFLDAIPVKFDPPLDEDILEDVAETFFDLLTGFSPEIKDGSFKIIKTFFNSRSRKHFTRFSVETFEGERIEMKIEAKAKNKKAQREVFSFFIEPDVIELNDVLAEEIEKAIIELKSNF